MENLTIGGLKEEVEGAKFLWETLIALASKHPIVAVLLLFAVVMVSFGQLRMLIDTVSSDYQAGYGRAIFASMGIAFLFAVGSVFYLSTLGGPRIVLESPKSTIDVIGDAFSGSWKVVDRSAQESRVDPPANTRYIFEFRGVAESQAKHVRTYTTYHSFVPPEGVFQWRVRAELDGETKGRTPSSYADWSAWQRNSYFRSTLERIRRTRTIRVGVSRDYLQPFIYHNEKTDDLDGIDIQVIEEIRKRMQTVLGLDQLNVRFQPNTWLEGNAADLREGITDVAIGEVGIVPDREDKYRIRFSKPYWWGEMAIVTRSGSPQPAVATARLTAWQATTFEAVAKKLSSNFVESKNLDQMFAKLNNGEVDGFIDNQYVVAANIRLRGEAGYTIRPLSRDEIPESIRASLGYPIPDGLYVDERSTELLDCINGILEDSETKTGIERIRREFGSSSVVEISAAKAGPASQ